MPPSKTWWVAGLLFCLRGANSAAPGKEPAKLSLGLACRKGYAPVDLESQRFHASVVECFPANKGHFPLYPLNFRLLDAMTSNLYHRTAMPKPPPRPLNPQVGARVPENLLIEIKVLATRQRRRFNQLVEEAFNDLLAKYREKSKGK